jgi:hypothetical protein
MLQLTRELMMTAVREPGEKYRTQDVCHSLWNIGDTDTRLKLWALQLTPTLLFPEEVHVVNREAYQLVFFFFKEYIYTSEMIFTGHGEEYNQAPDSTEIFILKIN